MNVHCPTCGHAQVVVNHDAMRAALTATQRRIFDLVVSSPWANTPGSIASAIYAADPNGGPLTAENTVSSTISQANRRLRAFGWKIEGQKGGFGYRLERLK